MELSVQSLLPSDNHLALFGVAECGSVLSLKKMAKYICNFLFRNTLWSPTPFITTDNFCNSVVLDIGRANTHFFYLKIFLLALFPRY